MVRLDQILVDFGLAPSRSKSQELIRSGAVEIYVQNQWKLEKRVSYNAQLLSADQIRICDNSVLKYVSRGGLKLEGALRTFQVSVLGLHALDVGVSTGGFTDCLLQHGARSVVGVDVGRDQAALTVRDHPSVTLFESQHSADLKTNDVFLATAPFDLLVMDVSFVSCLKVLPDVIPFLKSSGQFLILVKPQFELGRAALNKRGVVKDVGLYKSLQVTICEGLSALGLEVQGYEPSDLKGQDGNLEFFVCGRQRDPVDAGGLHP